MGRAICQLRLLAVFGQKYRKSAGRRCRGLTAAHRRNTARRPPRSAPTARARSAAPRSAARGEGARLRIWESPLDHAASSGPATPRKSCPSAWRSSCPSDPPSREKLHSLPAARMVQSVKRSDSGRLEEKKGRHKGRPRLCLTAGSGKVHSAVNHYGNGMNFVKTGTLLLTVLKLYFRSWKLGAVPSIVSISPIRVTSLPKSSLGAPSGSFIVMDPVGLPAITTPLRVSMRACVRFGSIVLSCTWSQRTKFQEVDTSLSKSLLLAFGTLADSL